jgi:hypothetical protein
MHRAAMRPEGITVTRCLTLAAAATVLVSALAVTACSKPPADGGGVATAATGGSATPAATPSRDLLAEMRRWAQCMRQHDVDMPDPQSVKGAFDGFDWPDKDDPEAARVDTARQACTQYDTFSEYTEPFSTAQLQAWLAWAQCMRGHGLEVSDPDPSGKPPMVNLKKHRTQPDVLAAAETDCLDDLVTARNTGQ